MGTKQNARPTDRKKYLEVTVGLEPTKASFAGWCLDRFGIATKSVVRKTSIQICTQIAPLGAH
jgi:hypothetical protein